MSQVIDGTGGMMDLSEEVKMSRGKWYRRSGS